MARLGPFSSRIFHTDGSFQAATISPPRVVLCAMSDHTNSYSVPCLLVLMRGLVFPVPNDRANEDDFADVIRRCKTIQTSGRAGTCRYFFGVPS